MNQLADAPLAADLLAEALRHVGSSVRDLREAHTLTQRQAARRAGLNQARWHRVESGDGPRLEDLLAIQHLFGIDSLEAFFGPYPSRLILEGGQVAASAPAAEDESGEATAESNA